jgi:hypothetical protein
LFAQEVTLRDGSYRISLAQLIADIGNARALAALERYRELEARGVREPEITFSPRGNSYSVRDPDHAILAANRFRHGAPPL